MLGRGYKSLMDWYSRCSQAQSDVMHGMWNAESAGLYSHALFARRDGQRHRLGELPGERNWAGTNRQGGAPE